MGTQELKESSGIYPDISKAIEEETKKRGLKVKPGEVLASTVPIKIGARKFTIEVEYRKRDDGGFEVVQAFVSPVPTGHCQYCGKPFPQTRKDRRFCKDSCRTMAAARKRNKKSCIHESPTKELEKPESSAKP